MHLIVLVMEDPDLSSSLMEAWERIGVKGATIIKSLDLEKATMSGLRDDVPLMPSLKGLERLEEHAHRTIFCLVDEESAIDQVVQVTEKVLGSFELEKSGFIFSLPVGKVFGL